MLFTNEKNSNELGENNGFPRPQSNLLELANKYKKYILIKNWMKLK